MGLEITWTRRALKLPARVRSDLERRLNRLVIYFPEIKPEMRVGITRAYDGLAFQSDEGLIKLLLGVSKKRAGGWRLPTYWTLAHEFMHLAQFNSHGIPGGERATDIYALARVPPKFIDDSPSYLAVPRGFRSNWGRRDAELAHRLAREAIKLRSEGLRRYALWWETEFEKAAKRRPRTR